ncbi:MAG: DJ-1/PfpI family protein [Ruminococcaceae bacterium]|nr:DJ-1/PfpI family protein [Oscillospiraceae bacterium]
MIIVLLADGFEEIEALTPVDMLRRAGLEVKTVGITSKIAVGSHGIPVVCDAVPADINLSDVSMAVFPGGMPGSLNLDAAPYTNEVIESVLSRGGHIAAICAAPLVFGRRGLLSGKRATCYPGFEHELVGATVTGEEFVTDGSITTGKGMEYSLPFAKELVRIAENK